MRSLLVSELSIISERYFWKFSVSVVHICNNKAAHAELRLQLNISEN